MRVLRVFTILAGLLAMALAVSPAAARPRDEVLSGAYRCAAIGEARVWLDCFYGAAQPVRAALGLRPAPENQLALVARPPAGAAAARDIALRDTVMSEVFRCGGQAEDRAWLDCYYAAVQPVRVSLGLAPGPAPKPAPLPVPIAPPRDQSRDQFGMPPPRPQPIGNAKQVSSRMDSYHFEKTGFFTVTLANGQVWRQVDGDTTFAHWKDAPERYQVRITHGFLNSFNLQVQNLPGLYKVERVQ